MPSDSRTPGPVRASAADTAAVLAEVAVPLVARGILLRRPAVLAAAERLDLDRRAVRRLQRLRDRYGEGPLLLRLPLREQALVLSPDHVHRVLEETPEPFATASSEKRAALSHFQPEGVLISTGAERAERRRFNEVVLDHDQPLHRLAERFVAVARQELAPLADDLDRGGEVGWDAFAVAWQRAVRRVVLGDRAADDHELTDLLGHLRAAANWAFLRPKRRGDRAELLRRLQEHLDRAEPGSLAAVIAATPTRGSTAPAGQVPQWLFAFDAGAIATTRALALLASHPEQAEVARAEVREQGEAAAPALAHLRACLLESVRLWPTTPVVLRQTTAETSWDGGTLPAGTGVAIFVPFFHRDDQRLPYANRFSPGLWLGERGARDWPLIPFSGGPGICPGRNLVQLLGSTALACLLGDRELRLVDPGRLGPDAALPATLDPFTIRIRATG